MLTRNKLETLSKLGDASAPRLRTRRPQIRLAYQLTPQRVLGERRATGVQFSVTGTDEVRRLDAGLVLTSIGYRGKLIRDLPFDESADVVPNEVGRVVDPRSGEPVPGAYVAGWIKRGPTGFIGTNKSCSMQTVQALVADFNADRLTDPVAKPEALAQLVHARRPDVVDSAGWRAIDAAEITRGSHDGRPRNKFTDVAEMLAAAATAQPAPPRRRRLLARMRGL
jgi:ferredoxin/flavodoxin---NADP+ reductase